MSGKEEANVCRRCCTPCARCLAPVAKACHVDHLDFALDGQPWKTAFGQARCSWIPQPAFFAIRVAIFLLWFATMIWSMVDWVNSDDINGEHYEYRFWWTQLTHLSLITELVYFGFAAATTGLALFGSVPDGTESATPWFVSVTWALQPMVLIVSLLVFVLYWALLFSPGDTVHAVSVFTHGINFGLMLLDLTLSRQPLYLVHIYMPLAFAVFYILFSLIYYAADGRNHFDQNNRYIYDVLDWNDAAAVGRLSALILLLGIPILWILLYCLGLFYRCKQAKGKVATLGAGSV